MAGAAVGGTLGFLKGGPMGAVQGAATGSGLGSFIGGAVQPSRVSVTESQQTAPLQTENIAQKYKLSDTGRTVLQGLEVARVNPEFQQFKQPLALAILQDIAQNNPARSV
jgi:hypothetical protein